MLGWADIVTALMCNKDYLTKPVVIWNLIGVMKGGFLSFELVIVSTINAVNYNYKARLSWKNLEIHNSSFI